MLIKCKYAWVLCLADNCGVVRQTIGGSHCNNAWVSYMDLFLRFKHNRITNPHRSPCICDMLTLHICNDSIIVYRCIMASKRLERVCWLCTSVLKKVYPKAAYAKADDYAFCPR